jgi:hypothetical protein
MRLLDRDRGIGLGRGADLAGAALVTGALMLGVYTIVRPAAEYGWTAGPTLGSGAAAAALPSGLVNTTVQVGGALGLAVLATLSAGRTAHVLTGGGPAAQALTSGYRLALLVGAGLVLAAITVALTALRPTHPTADAGRPAADAGRPAADANCPAAEACELIAA